MLKLENDGNKFLKLFQNEQFVGQLEYVFAADEAQIIDIYILEKYRQQGLGTKLLQAFIAQAKQRAKYIILEVRESNLAAQGLYAKFNFQNLSLRKNYYSNPTEDALVLKLDLSKS
jgi:ribosomal-protein-alanine N-acetyltransferase